MEVVKFKIVNTRTVTDSTRPLSGERQHVFFAFGPGEGICRQPSGKVKNVSVVFHEAT